MWPEIKQKPKIKQELLRYGRIASFLAFIAGSAVFFGSGLLALQWGDVSYLETGSKGGVFALVMVPLWAIRLERGAS